MSKAFWGKTTFSIAAQMHKQCCFSNNNAESTLMNSKVHTPFHALLKGVVHEPYAVNKTCRLCSCREWSFITKHASLLDGMVSHGSRLDRRPIKWQACSMACKRWVHCTDILRKCNGNFFDYYCTCTCCIHGCKSLRLPLVILCFTLNKPLSTLCVHL